MKIALVCQGFPAELLGGTEHTVQALAGELSRCGHDVRIIAGSDAWQAGFRCSLEHHPELGYPIHRIHRDDPHYVHWHKRHAPRVSQAYTDILRSDPPDVVHVHHELRLSNDLVRIAARLGIPSIVTLHDYSSTCLLHHRIQPANGAFCEAAVAAEMCIRCARQILLPTPWVDDAQETQRFADLGSAQQAELATSRFIVALSEDQAETLQTLLGLATRPHVIPPGLTYARRASAPGHRFQDPIRLGTWGTLYPLKGTDVLVEAVRIAIKQAVPVELDIAGQEADSHFAKRLQEAICGLPIRMHGRFEELTQHPVSHATAFVSGTRARETWGLVADEASALGLPLILPRHGAFPRRLSGCDDVLFYEPGEAASLAEVLVRLSRDKQAHDRFFARTKPHAIPTPEQTTARYLGLYRRAFELGAPHVASASPAQEQAEIASMRIWNAGFQAAYGHEASHE